MKALFAGALCAAVLLGLASDRAEASPFFVIDRSFDSGYYEIDTHRISVFSAGASGVWYGGVSANHLDPEIWDRPSLWHVDQHGTETWVDLTPVLQEHGYTKGNIRNVRITAINGDGTFAGHYVRDGASDAFFGRVTVGPDGRYVATVEDFPIAPNLISSNETLAGSDVWLGAYKWAYWSTYVDPVRGDLLPHPDKCDMSSPRGITADGSIIAGTYHWNHDGLQREIATYWERTDDGYIAHSLNDLSVDAAIYGMSPNGRYLAGYWGNPGEEEATYWERVGDTYVRHSLGYGTANSVTDSGLVAYTGVNWELESVDYYLQRIEDGETVSLVSAFSALAGEPITPYDWILGATVSEHGEYLAITLPLDRIRVDIVQLARASSPGYADERFRFYGERSFIMGDEPTTVPEPGTALLVLVGASALLRLRRQRQG